MRANARGKCDESFENKESGTQLPLPSSHSNGSTKETVKRNIRSYDMEKIRSIIPFLRFSYSAGAPRFCERCLRGRSSQLQRKVG